MRAVAKAQLAPSPGDIRRNPLTCIFMTTAVTVTFWVGMVWLAERLMG